MVVNESATVEEMMLFIPHEAMHALQFAACPDLLAFHSTIVCDVPPPPSLPVMPRPYDYLWAMNMAEMAAYAVQVDFAHQLATRGEDDGALTALNARMGGLGRLYPQVIACEKIARLGVGKRLFMHGTQDVLSAEQSRACATAATGYLWFWAGVDTMHYNTHLVDAAAEKARNNLSAQFNMAAAKPQFRKWARADIVRLGTGYPVNPLDVPGFDDVSTPPYRNMMTRDSAKKLYAVERALRPA